MTRGRFGETVVLNRSGWGSDGIEAATAYDLDSVHLYDFRKLEKWANDPAAVMNLALGDRARYARRSEGHFRGLALDVASHPRLLGEIDWLELEKLINEVLDGLGFDTLRTPPAGDGGKDIVVRCLHGGASGFYYVELKHWRSGKRVGPDVLKALAGVVARDGARKGLVLSSSGLTRNPFAGLTPAQARLVQAGGPDKIFSLCALYKFIKAGLAPRPKNPAELLFAGTVKPRIITAAA